MTKQFTVVEQLLLDADLFVDKVFDDLICVICQHVILNPVHLPCGHIFCSECLRLSLIRKKQCPSCRMPVSRDNVSFNAYVSLKISGLKVKCKNCPIVTLVGFNGGTILSHMEHCGETFVECNYCQGALLGKDSGAHAEICYLGEIMEPIIKAPCKGKGNKQRNKYLWIGLSLGAICGLVIGIQLLKK
ncbi:MAG: putative RING finger protein 151-like protein [Hyperionvirus sp.]|uniref:Putative RING finger protein 151-like protein n=1 Tax=Hyperionvirus sp. TaxID=2487770 RepID=A0A3G5AA20_9VIRU|nr:MAG: putative RING finger protein 151-like protein [Hyperionvirus sp.]